MDSFLWLWIYDEALLKCRILEVLIKTDHCQLVRVFLNSDQSRGECYSFSMDLKIHGSHPSLDFHVSFLS